MTGTTAQHAGPLRVVVVDDHEMVVVGLKAMLTPFAGRVRVVGSRTAPRRPSTSPLSLTPDIVLCDVRLRGDSGLDLCRTLAERAPDQKVVLLSVYDDEQYLYQALRAGAAGLPAQAHQRRGPRAPPRARRHGDDRRRPDDGRAGGRRRRPGWSATSSGPARAWG